MCTGSTRETIMVVEDEPEVRSFLELALRRHGYAVEKREDGEEALQFLDSAEDPISLVLLDVLMPRKNGLATLQQLRQPHRDLPVVMLSGAASMPTIVEAMKSGANDFLSKPIGNAELAAAVQKALSAAPRQAAVAPPQAALATASGTRAITSGSWMRSKDQFLAQV